MASFLGLERDELAGLDDVELLGDLALTDDVLVLVDRDLLDEVFQTVLLLNLKLPQHVQLEQRCLKDLPLLEVAISDEGVVSLAV